MERIELFCLPFAGGNKYSYRDYESVAPADISIVPLEYPGRGARIREPLLSDMAAVVEDMYVQIKQRISHLPYAIYGHSMGALVTLLLVKKMEARGDILPLRLFMTGTTGPSAYFNMEKKKRHLLSKQDFIQEMRELDGSPEEILNSPDLLNYFEPILRADFKAAETFQYRPSNPLSIPITVITGTDEPMKEQDIHAWQEETCYPVEFMKLPGKHFFIFKNAAAVMQVICNKLTSKKVDYE